MSKAEVQLSTSFAEQLAGDEYGIEARARRLPGYSIQNFLLETRSGEWLVLKVASADVDEGRLDLENRVLRHIVSADLALKTPCLVLARDDREIVEVERDGHELLRVRLLTYVAGEPWAECNNHPPELRRSVGRALAELDECLEHFSHAETQKQFEWDLRQVLRQRKSLLAVASPARQQLGERVLHELAASLFRLAPHLRRSLVHGDANEHNLLVDSSESPPRLAGLIDFSDVVESFTICEPAIAAAYTMLGEEDPLPAGAEVIAGYDELKRLSEAELEAAFPLACGRLVQSVLASARHRQSGRTNEHLFVSEAAAWQALEELSRISPAQALETLQRTCGRKVTSARGKSPSDLLARRSRRIGPSLSVSYRRPLKVERGSAQYLYDHQGRAYLDLVNNVCHVGHCHPRVVEAGVQQMARLNTNTRYLYDGLIDYADRLCATLPEELEVCYFVCSGSEANELAIRIARTHTARQGLVVMDSAYHGHTGTLIEASPYKFRGAGGSGEAGPHVYLTPTPDGYRGPHKGSGPETGTLYVQEVGRAIEEAGEPIAAFLCEPLLGCGGQIVPPEGFLSGAFAAVRAAGGVCVADEVQVGLGRVGTDFWAFEAQDAVPDIVVLGKPLGNGHPMAAVITTREIADSFANGMEFFSTFGGNPISCAIGMAVLEVIEEEQLQARALRLGRILLEGLRELQERHPLIGDIRGRGLFVGIELVRDRETLEPATAEAGDLIDWMREEGVLLSTDGPLHNVLKVKPPMVLTRDDIEMFLRSFDRALANKS